VDGNVSKVPLLGDIPGLGRLFRYDSRTRKKTNLLVFLRPIVIRDAGNAWDVTANRYDYIRSTSASAELPHLPPMPDYKMPDMQNMPARPGTPGAPTPPRSPASMTPGLAEIFGSDRPPPPQNPPSLSGPQPDLPGVGPSRGYGTGSGSGVGTGTGSGNGPGTGTGAGGGTGTGTGSGAGGGAAPGGPASRPEPRFVAPGGES
jgi:general secretion pathway protein D